MIGGVVRLIVVGVMGLVALTACDPGLALPDATPEARVSVAVVISSRAAAPSPTAPLGTPARVVAATASPARTPPAPVTQPASPTRDTPPEPSQHAIAVLGPPPVIATRPSTPAPTSGCGPDLPACIAALVDDYGASGVAGVVITEGDGVPVVALHSDRAFATASLYKLFVLWGVQRAIADGDLDDDTLLTFTSEDDDSEEDGYLPWAIGDRVSVSEARELMITASNNSAAWLLARTVGWEEIDRLLRANGFAASRTLEGISTPREIAAFFDGILTRTLDPRLRAADYEVMLDLLHAQVINTYLSPGFPPGIPFAHKTGNLPGVVNDAGILFLPDGRAVTIAVMTEGNESASFALMSEVAAAVWGYYGR